MERSPIQALNFPTSLAENLPHLRHKGLSFDASKNSYYYHLAFLDE
jgi:hypothetical protein